MESKDAILALFTTFSGMVRCLFQGAHLSGYRKDMQLNMQKQEHKAGNELYPVLGTVVIPF